MRGQNRNCHKRIDTTEAGSQGKQIQRLSQPSRILAAAIDFEAEHATAAAHLLHRESALRVPLKERIMDTPYFGMTGEKLRDAQRIFILPLHSDSQCFHAPQQQPGCMRIHIPTKRGAGFANRVDQIAAAGNYASN